MKPEIVFFGENLPEQFHRAMKYDKDEVDLLIVIGSSLKVRPVALIPSKLAWFWGIISDIGPWVVELWNRS
jgi:NAD-dependent deacetylase sirtuin 1